LIPASDHNSLVVGLARRTMMLNEMPALRASDVFQRRFRRIIDTRQSSWRPPTGHSQKSITLHTASQPQINHRVPGV